MAKYQAPRGTHDIVPAPRHKDTIFESHRWQYVEGVYAGLARQFGYEEIRTPMFEDIDLFLRTSGETSDAVSKEMYEFMDKGDRHIALKPEGTAPVMRAYLELSLGNQGATTRLWYFTHSFRYGRPQKGRYRQLHQFGAELIGSASPWADAEIIDLTVQFFEKIGIKGLKVMVNSIGREETRARYQDVILNQVKSWMADQTTDVQKKMLKNPLRILDTKDEKLRAILMGMPSILDYLEDASKAHFDGVQSALDEMGIAYAVSDDVVRGLDYYTDTVFEVVSESLGEGLSLCGGGRYDNLIKQIGGPDTPSVGVGIGVERALLAMEDQAVSLDVPQPLGYVVSATEDAQESVRGLVRSLRSSGLDVQWDVDQRKLKQQFKAADRTRAKYTLVLGTDEVQAGTVTVKDMASSEQVTIPQSEVAEWLSARA